jgi:hypothetical protein
MPENKDDAEFIESEGVAMEECLLLGSMFDREEDKEG